LLAVAAVAEAQLASPGHVDVTTGVVLTAAVTVPLVAARRFLAPVAVVVCAAAGALLAVYGTPPVAAIAGLLVVLYLVAARYPRWAAALALLPLAGNAVYPYRGGDPARPMALLLCCLGLVAVAFGDTRRQRGRANAERDQARREIVEIRHDRAVLAERSRIARELHDVVAHHVSMMVVRAETARVGTPGMPAAGTESLTAIRDAGRQALTEMRRLLGVLRTDPDARPDRHPQPGLDNIGDLVDAARAAGTNVCLRRDGTPGAVSAGAVSAGVQLCAYRIVQEALTNVRRHAPHATAEVVIHHTGHTLRVSVRDTGPGPVATATDGHGMLGMRERVAMVGGVLHAGPVAGGGFLVRADLPAGGPG
jgi:signal transduction histidine kinase